MHFPDEQVIILGIDTSCYTTSVAIVGAKEVVDRRLLLEVPAGKRGLRQAEAVFQHVKNLPVLLEEVLPYLGITGVAVSSQPRSATGSYLPVFRTGEAMARGLALAWNVPCYLVSHQAGHIWAGLFGGRSRWEGTFLALHISGGTTEIGIVDLSRATQEDAGTMELLGGSLDLHAGQLIDRIGVKLGLGFPAGPEVEKLAQDGRRRDIPPFALPVSVSGLHVNLSGPETAAMRGIEAGADPASVAQGVEICLAETLTALALHAAETTGLARLLVVGGVACNQYIRRHLESHLGKAGIATVFTTPELSRDNAVGVAAYGQWRQESEAEV